MIYKHILAIDPSGSFNEGKGVTGWCLYTPFDGAMQVGFIQASAHKTQQSYWKAHLDLLDTVVRDTVIVIEDYLLYATKASQQIGSRMETPKLIGVMEYHCGNYKLPVVFQTAGEVKKRWTNEILEHKGFLVRKGNGWALPNFPDTRINNHTQDAIRHAVHYAQFKNQRR